MERFRLGPLLFSPVSRKQGLPEMQSLIFHYATVADHRSLWALTFFSFKLPSKSFISKTAEILFNIWLGFSKIVSLYDLREFPHVLFSHYSRVSFLKGKSDHVVLTLQELPCVSRINSELFSVNGLHFMI